MYRIFLFKKLSTEQRLLKMELFSLSFLILRLQIFMAITEKKMRHIITTIRLYACQSIFYPVLTMEKTQFKVTNQDCPRADIDTMVNLSIFNDSVTCMFIITIATLCSVLTITTIHSTLHYHINSHIIKPMKWVQICPFQE